MLSPERQSARMSEIKNARVTLDLDGNGGIARNYCVWGRPEHRRRPVG